MQVNVKKNFYLHNKIINYKYVKKNLFIIYNFITSVKEVLIKL